MSLLDDPALRMRAPNRGYASSADVLKRASFSPSSAFARDFDIPAGAVGEIRDRYKREDGCEVLSLWIEGVGLATGVPALEVIVHGDHPTYP